MRLKAEYKGYCTACRGRIAIGEEIEWSRDKTALRSNSYHLRCWVPARVGPTLSDLEGAEDFIKFALTSTREPILRMSAREGLLRNWKLDIKS